MDLTAYELARLRVEDGLGQSGDQALLNEEVKSHDLLLKQKLEWAFQSVEAPSIADAVMRRVGRFSVPVGGSIEEEVQSTSLSASVMEQLGLGEGIGAHVVDAIVDEAGPAPALWDDLCASVGGTPMAGAGGILRQAIQQESDPGFQKTTAFQVRRPWWAVGVAAGAVLAAAAAILLYMGFAVESGPAVEASMGSEDMEVGE